MRIIALAYQRPLLFFGAVLLVVFWGWLLPLAAAEQDPVVINPDDPNSPIYMDAEGNIAGKGDADKPVSDAYKFGMALRPGALNDPKLPKDKFGLIDWVAMIEKGFINPSAGIESGMADVPPMEKDILMPAKGNFVNDVVFRHSTHTYWSDCEACHPAIFEIKGENKITMAEISRGKWCGRCHNKVAFPLTDCRRCHSKKKVKK